MNLYAKMILGLCALTVVGACSSARVTDETRERTLPAGGVTTLTVAAVSGNVTIEGVEGLETIEATAAIRRSTGPESIVFDLVGEGDEAILTAEFDATFEEGSNVRLMDVVVKTPPRLALVVNDGPGDLVIRNLERDVDITNESGQLLIENVGGSVTIVDDGVGDVQVDGVGGDLTLIGDDSGRFTFTRVAGHIERRPH